MNCFKPMVGLNQGFSSPCFVTTRFHSLNFPIRNPHQLSNFRHRRRFPVMVCSLELPLLPFPVSEVLVPSESKILHLFEARYLALLEESLSKTKKLFVHFVLEPVIISNSSPGESFAAKYGCLVYIENVEPLDVGALVSIRGICRVKIVKFLQAEPYLKGEVTPLQDKASETATKMNSKIIEVKEGLRSLNSLEIKLKAPKDETLQTQIANSLSWSQKGPSVDCDESFIPSLAERICFAALQPLTGSSQSELLKLQLEKLKAMDLRDTLQRIDYSLELVKENISLVAAKLAIQSLGIK